MAQKKKPATKGSKKVKTSSPKPPARKLSAAPKARAAAKPAPAAPKPAAAVAAKPTPKTKITDAKAALKRQKPAASADAKATPGGAKAERARARKLTIEISANEAASALAAKWSTLFKRSDHIDAKPYSMTSSFEERTAIVHKVLGWGYILANRNDRLEVLFKDGIKYLISNYKP